MAAGGMELPGHWAVFSVDRSYRLIEANEAYLLFYKRFYGMRLHPGQSVLEGLSGIDRGRLTQRFEVAEKEGGFTVEETHFLDGNGFRFVGHYCPVLNGGPEIKGFRVFMEEVTLIRELKEALETAQAELEASYRMRDTIFSVIGHDLRGPVSQINALVYLMRERPDFLTPDRVGTYANELERANGLLTQALENLLEWARIHRSGLQARATVFVAETLIRDAIDMLRVDFERKGVKVDYTGNVALTLETDRSMFAFIVRNLLANAIKFTPAGGRITVAQKYDAEAYCVAVSDTGVGMPSYRLAALRAREHVTTPGTGGERGVGLGLAVCCEFALAMGGQLAYESEEGKGTSVSLRLPGNSVRMS